jgi:hypothetical protein
LAGSSSEIAFTERPVDDPEVRCPDISLARAELGWEPKVTLIEGIARTIAWARQAWVRVKPSPKAAARSAGLVPVPMSAVISPKITSHGSEKIKGNDDEVRLGLASVDGSIVPPHERHDEPDSKQRA